MKAIRCHAFGPPDTLVLEDAPAPVPRPGQALITVRAAGVNFVDALCMQGTYQIKPALPFIPGMEVAGIVSAVTDGASAVAVGDRTSHWRPDPYQSRRNRQPHHDPMGSAFSSCCWRRTTGGKCWRIG
ncbi:MAG: NADPH:quinone reductase [Alphaproteobacteria bacterium]|nr:NADPH:quinone reductase [Alphaproteobacteria bacterium]